MDDSPYNPFLNIDKKRFPKSKDEKKSSKKGGAQARPSVTGTGPSAVQDRGPGLRPSGLDNARSEAAPPDDEELFSSAMSGVKPIGGAAGRIAEAKPAAVSAVKTSDAQRDEEEFLAHSQLLDLVSGKIEFSLEHSDEYIKGCVVGLDPKTFSRLKTGWYPPEAHLDLHGQSAPQAADALLAFMRDSYLNNRRCVLLIPGRGKNSPEGYGVLRERVQAWLTRDPCKRVVLAFCTAQPRHGGAGALYVLLRKRKGEGKIRWDRIAVEPESLV
jgi:DNA-nicking Smr family endonuclease